MSTSSQSDTSVSSSSSCSSHGFVTRRGVFSAGCAFLSSCADATRSGWTPVEFGLLLLAVAWSSLSLVLP